MILNWEFNSNRNINPPESFGVTFVVSSSIRLQCIINDQIIVYYAMQSRSLSFPEETIPLEKELRTLEKQLGFDGNKIRVKKLIKMILKQRHDILQWRNGNKHPIIEFKQIEKECIDIYGTFQFENTKRPSQRMSSSPNHKGSCTNANKKSNNECWQRRSNYQNFIHHKA